jgi:starvation-inducible outer membrane lipoprotein
MTILPKTILALALFLLLVGCASHPPRIDCERHLKPINAPAPVTKAGVEP